MDLLQDQSVIQHAIDGDQCAISSLLKAAEPTLREHLAGQIGRSHRSAFDLDDVLQAVFLEIFLRFSEFEFRSEGSLQAWMTTIARSSLLNAIRAIKTHKRSPKDAKVVSNSDRSAALIDEISGSITAPSVRASRNEMHTAIDRALAVLPPDYAAVIRHCDLDGMTAPEAAIEMKRSIGSVYMLKQRARVHLVELLDSESKFFTNVRQASAAPGA